MTQVKLDVQISGTRNGEDWPPPGTVLDFPEAEARDLIAAGQGHAPAEGESKEPRPPKPWESVGVASNDFPAADGRAGPVLEREALAPRDQAVYDAVKEIHEGKAKGDVPQAGTKGSKIVTPPQSPNAPAPAGEPTVDTTAKATTRK